MQSVKYGKLSQTISAKPAGVMVASQRLIPTDERSGFLTHIATMENVSLCMLTKNYCVSGAGIGSRSPRRGVGRCSLVR